MRTNKIKQYIDSLFEGRVGRGTFFHRIVFTLWGAVFFLYFIVSIFCGNFNEIFNYFDKEIGNLIFSLILSIVVGFLACIAIIRRLHDIGNSGFGLVLYLVLWIILLVMYQFGYFNIGTIIIFITIVAFNFGLLFFPSDKGKNEYGENPNDINEKNAQEEYEKAHPQRETREKKRQEREEKLPKWRKKIRDFDGFSG